MRTLICVVGCAFLLLFYTSPAQAQCNCDFIVPASSYLVDATTLVGVNGQVGVKPGNKVCLANGTRIDIMMMNFIGTAANPILITNMCDGQVKVQGASPSTGRLMYMGNCKYVHVSGSGNPNVPYGIEMTVGIQGIDFRDLSTNVEADHLYIHDIGYSALNAKTDPTCDPATWRGNFTMRDVWIHDNKVANTGGEGVYIGESHYHTTVGVSCNGTTIQAQEHETIGCKVYNNSFTNIGRDGIQVGAVTSGGEIHHNTITNFGTTNEYGQQSGIQINPGTNAEIYDNVVDTGTGFGLFAGGRGGSHVYNNVIANCAQGAIICEDYAPVDPSGFIFSNNTLVNNKTYGIYMYSQNTLQNQFVNNIVVGTTEAGFQFVKFNSANIKFTDTNNIKTQDISTVKFVNATAKDWHLQGTSAAKDAGKDMSSYGVTKDFEDTARPQGAAPDLGAYEIKVSGSNTAPVANAGTDKTITLPTSAITITGSGTDADGTIASYTWTQVAGGTATLGSTTTATLSLTGLVAGTYTFRLTVKDNAGASATDDVIVTVKAAGSANAAPVANAGADKTVTLPTTTATLTGSGTDADGTIASYAWTKVSGGSATLANATTATLSLSGLATGSYTFRLTVKDNAGASATDDVAVTVKAAGNAAPVPNAGADKTITFPTAILSIAGSATDSDGTVMYWEWTKVSGGTAILANVGLPTLSLSALIAGTYVFRLKVTDNLGAWAVDDVTVTVKPLVSGSGLTADAGTDKTVMLPTTATTLNGSGTDTNGTIAYYAWSKVSGGTATLANAGTANLNVTGMAAGNYNFRLTVTDNSGATASDDVAVVVKSAGNVYPVSNAGADQTITLPASALTISSSSTDSDGYIMYWEWSKVSGGAATLANVGQANLSVSGLVAGTYVFRLKVTDNLGGWSTDDVTVTVKATGTTTARAATASDYSDAPETTNNADVAYAPQSTEDDFAIMNKQFPAGHEYAIIVFDANGTRIYAGPWNADMFPVIFEAGKMYVYQVIQDGVMIDTGKVSVGR